MYSAKHYQTFDPSFREDLEASMTSVHLAAADLVRAFPSIPVQVPPLRIRPAEHLMNKYSDDGDLFFKNLRIEVKQRRLAFTSLDDFPYNDIIVDVAHAWTKAQQKPYAYIIYNKDLSAKFVILGKTSPEWKIEQKRDRFKNRLRRFALAPKRCFISWDAFIEVLASELLFL